MTPNTATLIAWMKRMMQHTDLCGAALCEALAEAAGESGNESPSDEALVLANEWESRPALIFDYIRNSGKWCLSPTAGCYRHCDVWKQFREEASDD